MNKEEFLAAIREKLKDLPQGDIERSLDYYAEMIDDYIENGMSAEEAVEAMGTVEEIASQILMDLSVPKLMKAKMHSNRVLRVGEIVLLILGSPIWFSLLLAAAIVFLSVYLVVWSFIVVLYAVVLSTAVSGVYGMISGIFLAFKGTLAQCLLFIGIGLVLTGVTILLLFASMQAGRWVIMFSKWIVIKVKTLLIRNRKVDCERQES